MNLIQQQQLSLSDLSIMGYDFVIKNKQGEDMHQDAQSYNWKQVGLQNPLLVKMFGGHTSATVVQMCMREPGKKLAIV